MEAVPWIIPNQDSGQPQQPAQPLQCFFFELGQGRRRTPQQADVVQRGDQGFRQHSRKRPTGGEVSHEAWVIPVHHVRKNRVLEIGENIALRRRVSRRFLRQLVKQRPGLDIRLHTQPFRMRQIVGDPVYDGMPCTTEFLGFQVACGRRFGKIRH